MKPTLPKALDELVNKDIGSMLKDKMPKTMDISSISIGSSVSSDKLIQAISENPVTSNIFGVFDTKQVVQELSANLESVFSNELISSLNPENLTNMMSKLGEVISTDVLYNSAVSGILDTFSSIKETALGTLQNTFSSITGVFESSGLNNLLSIGGISLSDELSNFLPTDITPGDFESLKTLYNGPNGINNFNICDGLDGLLSWSQSLIDPSALLESVSGLFGLVSKYDISGILNCVSSIQDSFDITTRSNLMDTIIGNGAVSAFSDITSIFSNNGSITDTFQAIQKVATSYSPKYDPYTFEPGDMFETPSELQMRMDSVFTNLNVNKESFLAVQHDMNTPLSSVIDPIYDHSRIVSIDPVSKFTSYCFNDNGDDELLRAIPPSFLS